MQICSVIHEGGRRLGIIDGDTVALTRVGSLEEALVAGKPLSADGNQRLALEDAQLDAPVRPPVVLCAGQNYRDHLDEKSPVTVDEPEMFLKAGQTIAAPAEPFRYDERITRKLDYETELGIVIGKRGRYISRERALDHVFGYVVVNDLGARDRQVRREPGGSFTMALGISKNFDGATRFGEWITTADEVPDPQDLALRTTVNDELRQSNNTANMIFSVAEIIVFLSSVLTLQPGTIIATGTPGGTGWGQDPELGGTGVIPAGCVPARYLSPGDEVLGEIERVGSVDFSVVEDGGSPI